MNLFDDEDQKLDAPDKNQSEEEEIEEEKMVVIVEGELSVLESFENETRALIEDD